MRHRLIQSNSGVILLTVIMMVIVLSLVTLSFFGSSVSQVKSSQSVIDDMKAEQLTMGEFFRYHQRCLQGSSCPTPVPSPVNLDDKTFTYQAPAVTASPLNNTNQVTFQVSY